MFLIAFNYALQTPKAALAPKDFILEDVLEDVIAGVDDINARWPQILL